MISPTEYRRFFAWDRRQPYTVIFEDESQDSVAITTEPEPVFSFDPARHSLPCVNVITDPGNLWDPALGIYVWGDSINFDQRGSAWERTGILEYYLPDGTQLLSEPTGIRINGQTSRYHSQKGLRLYFDDYGTSDELDFSFFAEGPTTFRRVILRDNHHPSDMLKSNLIEKVFQDLGHLVSRTTFATSYLNGEYWGTVSIRDRIDDEFFQHTLGVEGEFILLKDGSAEHGDAELWNDFLLSFGEAEDCESHAWFEAVNAEMDLETYIDWLFLNAFCATTDNGFAGNVFIYRLAGGKWTHLIWDEDNTFFVENQYAHHLRFYAAEDQVEFEEFNPPRSHWEWSPWHQHYCTMFNRLMRNSEFKALFAARVGELLDGPASVNVWLDQLQVLVDELSPEIDLHAERWEWYSPNYFYQTQSYLQNWITARHPFMIQEVADFMEHFRAPVELSDFTVEGQEGGVLVSWRTESEEGIAGYILYRSVGGLEDMVPIATHESYPELMSAGGIWAPGQYHFLDETVSSDVPCYYQIGYVEAGGGGTHLLDWVEAINVPSEEARGLVVNEFLASNDTGLQDENGQYEDWLEVFNPTDEAVNLEGLYLSDSLADPYKWAMPAFELAPGGFLIVFCDDDLEDGPMHATFKLSADGESIGLFDANTDSYCDSFSFGPQTTDISMGRLVDGGSEWGYFDEPTPGATNGSAVNVVPGLPLKSAILGSSPNPFNPRTTIEFRVAESGPVSIKVRNLRGYTVRDLVDGYMTVGRHHVGWDGCGEGGRALSSGTYFLEMRSGGKTSVHRVMMVK